VALIPTFAEFRADPRNLPSLAGLDAITEWVVYDAAVYARVQDILAEPAAQGRQGAVTDELARDVLTSLFGEAWVKRHFDVPDRVARRECQDSPAQSREVVSLRVLSVQRLRELARRLYEFQSYPWFDHYVAHVRANGDVASSLFEGDVLRTLMRRGARVERTVESGVKGMDFDITATFAGWDQPIPVEAKAKGEDTEYSANTVKNTLRTAAAQMPPGSAGWVFLRIPAAWVGPRLEAGYGDAVFEGVRQTSRIAAVFTAIDKVHLSSDRRSASVQRVWDNFPCPNGPDPLEKVALGLYRFIEHDMDYHFAPQAPF
jgi:hypothetical protein